MKQTVKFEIDSDLLEAAHRLNIDLNEVVVQAVRAKVEHKELISVDDFQQREQSPLTVKIDLEEPVSKSEEPGDEGAAPRPDVMALYEEGEKEFDELYKRVAN